MQLLDAFRQCLYNSANRRRLFPTITVLRLKHGNQRGLTNTKEFSVKEVKPPNRGWYLVSMRQFLKEKPEHPDYIKDRLEFKGVQLPI